MIYAITIKDKFDGREFTGKFDQPTKKRAIAQAIDFYTYELDTDETGIEIVRIER
jgi:hypothetical protein